jgi:hypothetical protein
MKTYVALYAEDVRTRLLTIEHAPLPPRDPLTRQTWRQSEATGRSQPGDNAAAR